MNFLKLVFMLYITSHSALLAIYPFHNEKEILITGFYNQQKEVQKPFAIKTLIPSKRPLSDQEYKDLKRLKHTINYMLGLKGYDDFCSINKENLN